MRSKEDATEFDPMVLAYSYFNAYVAIQNPKFQFARHNLLLCQKLQDVEAGKIKRLIICMPPRHGKTVLASEDFPAWYLGRNPDKQIIAATYSFDRAGDTGRKVRNQLLDPVHQEIFPDCKVSPDTKSSNKLMTQQGGIMVSIGIGGAATGRGADLLLIDDPIKGREDAESENVRRKLHDWFQGVAYTRLMPGGAIIIIQTRWHFDDLVGFCTDELEHECWDVVSLEAICENEDEDLLGRKNGEALWPERFGLPMLESIRETIGSREWASQYQQSPIAQGGNYVRLEDFQRYDYAVWKRYDMKTVNGIKADIPFGIKRIICSWDTAYKEAQLNDPTSCTVWGISDIGYYLLWVLNKRLKYPALWRALMQIYEKNLSYGLGPPLQLIEDKGSGTTLIQEAKAKTRIPVVPIKPEGSKELRFENITSVIEGGLVYLPNRQTWLSKYETDLIRFPYGKEDDNVDSTSQFLKFISKPMRSKKIPKYWK